MPGEEQGEGCSLQSLSSLSPRKFTWRELSKLNKPYNAHVAYRGKVYDVSKFVSAHPGGVDQIMMGASHDITHIFEAYHSDDAVKLLGEYYVGELVDNEMPVYTDTSSKFYSTVKKRVREYFKSKNIDPKVDYKMFATYIIFIIGVFICWYYMMVFHNSLLVGGVFAISWGIFTGLATFSVGHDTSHYAITHKPWIWRVTNAIIESISGISTYCWIYQHTYGHHNYTNVDGSDPDIVTTDDIPDVWRIKTHQQWVTRYLYQHLYMPVLYCLLAIKMRLQDFHTIFILKKGTIRMNPPSLYQWVLFFGTKIVHITFRFFIPMWYMSLSSLLLFNLVYDLVFGFWLAIFTQLNHISTEVTWLQPDQANSITTNNWAELQVLTTKDYGTDSWFWTLIAGALNHQVAHHLFPSVIQSHYRHITPIVRQTCKEFGLQYHSEENIAGAIYEHLKYLFYMGHSNVKKQQ